MNLLLISSSLLLILLVVSGCTYTDDLDRMIARSQSPYSCTWDNACLPDNNLKPVNTSIQQLTPVNMTNISLVGIYPPANKPGAIDPNVTQDNIQQTICVSGYTATVRPSTYYTNKIKRESMESMGFTNMSAGEGDHIISLELGGCADCPENIWYEPYDIQYGARQKDYVENLLHRMVCNGSMTLADAQKDIVTKWVYYYQTYHGVD